MATIETVGPAVVEARVATVMGATAGEMRAMARILVAELLASLRLSSEAALGVHVEHLRLLKHSVDLTRPRD